MKKSIVLFLSFILMACSPTEAQIQEAIEKTNSAASTQTVEYLNSTEIIAKTPTLTKTPNITNTPSSTNTPRPTSTPTPKPKPILIEGSGDDVVEVDKWDGPAIVDIVSKSDGHFSVKSYSENGEDLDLLVNRIGPYIGKVTMDLMVIGNTQTSLLEINSRGDWSISIYPIDRKYINQMDAPGYYENNTDDVVFVDGTSRTATFTCMDGHFAVWGISERSDLLINEIAPYEGKVMIPDGLFLLIVSAESNWSAEFH